jgi:Pyridine nucleotide-disulphide oxidoreductase
MNSAVPLQIDPTVLNCPRGRQFGLVTPSDLQLREDDPPMQIDIAICGAGLIGCGIACHLQHDPVLRNRFVMFDRQKNLVGQFFERMQYVDQRVMRSPYEHHIAPDGDIQLLDFARLFTEKLTEIERNQIMLALTGQRTVVPTDIFIGHTSQTIASHQLTYRAFSKEVTKIEPATPFGWKLTLCSEQVVKARAVIVATGAMSRGLPKVFNEASRTFHNQVHSVYEHSVDPMPGEHIVLVGSGQSAGHWLKAASEQGTHVTWLVRKDDRYRCTDFDTKYFRTEGLVEFQKMSIDCREKLLREESRGSIMLEFRTGIESMLNQQQLEILRGIEIKEISDSSGRLDCILSSGPHIIADRIVVANGLTTETSLIDSIATFTGEWPQIDEANLQIKGVEGLFVAGALAGLAIGPGCRVVDGVRLAVERLLPTLRQIIGGQTFVDSSLRIRGTRAIVSLGSS